MNCDECKTFKDKLFGLAINGKYSLLCEKCRSNYNICYCGSCDGNNEKWRLEK